jgi:hypothetical protein
MPNVGKAKLIAASMSAVCAWWGKSPRRLPTMRMNWLRRSTGSSAAAWKMRSFCVSSKLKMAIFLSAATGTELSFPEEVRQWAMAPWSAKTIRHKTAVFRQINKDKAYSHHDALEFPDGQIILLTTLGPGQRATVLQLPAAPQKVRRGGPPEMGPMRI